MHPPADPGNGSRRPLPPLVRAFQLASRAADIIIGTAARLHGETSTCGKAVVINDRRRQGANRRRGNGLA